MGNPFQGDFDSSSLKLRIEELYLNRLGQSTKDQLDAHECSQRIRLEEMGTFQRLDKEISDALIQTFFAVVYPLCPIFDLSEFHTKYRAEQVSPLVLQALYFVAASHCEQSLIEKAGFPNRHMATFTFYQRAKALYDANYESDAIATVQALYLLSYWWGSPLEQKDMWHWTGLAAYCTALLLSEADIEDDKEDIPDTHLLGSQTQEGRLYIVYLVDLAKRSM
ncbi:transcription factor fungal specific [Aspergillus fumigatus]|nr:transcription factor fungal specific [Aspergillus fumigatus]